MPAAVLIGIPIYSNAAGIIPVVSALIEKGAAMGTVLAFMMSVVAISFPETVILRKVLKPRLILVFTGVVAVGYHHCRIPVQCADLILGVCRRAGESKETKMNIKVLGPGCKKCHETEKLVKEVIAETGSDAVVEYVTDIAEIAKLGIFSTPAVVVDGRVKLTGKVPAKSEVKSWLGK